MAEPVGITGTAVGIISLGFQVYSSLKAYVDEFQGRDKHLATVSVYLARLESSLTVIRTALPALENEFRAEHDVVVSCLSTCETSLRALDEELQKHSSAPAADLKGKAKELKKKLKYPFAVPEVEKLARELDRINNLLLVALQGLGLSIQPSNNKKLADISTKLADNNHLARATAADVTSMSGKIDTVMTRDVDLRTRLDNNQEALVQHIQGLSVSMTETTGMSSRVRHIEETTSLTASHMQELVSGHRLHQQQTGNIEEKLSELKDLIVQSKSQSPTEQALQMLLSKPAYLKSWQDELTDTQPSPWNRATAANRQQTPILHPSCNCRHRRRKTSTYSRWSAFIFFEENLVDTQHEPECPRYSEYQTTRDRSVGITYTGLLRLLNIAVTASFHSSRGAGGASFSPVFRYYAVVDTYRSPAFRIVRTISSGLRDILDRSAGSTRAEIDSFCNQIIVFGISKLRKAFAEKAALPTDIDNLGRTLHASIFDRTSLSAPSNREATPSLMFVHGLMIKLLDFHVPIHNPYPSPGHSSLFYKSMTISYLTMQNSYLESELVPILFQEVRSSPLSLSPEEVLWDNPTFRRLIWETKDMPEALGLDNPLFTALLAKDEILLRSVLQERSVDINSPASSGVTAIQIALFWPKGLEIILNTCQDIDLDVRSLDISLLDLADLVGGDICAERIDDYSSFGKLCSGCSCTESVRLLLEFGCYIDTRYLWKQDWEFPWRDPDKYIRARPCTSWVVLDHIKEWRLKLAELARARLSHATRHRIGAVDNVLVWDCVTPPVIYELEAIGVSPFSLYGLRSGDCRLRSSSTPGYTIYHHIKSATVAEIAFDMGFRDINSPLSDCPLLFSLTKGLPGIMYCEWLIGHGANFLNALPRPRSAATHRLKTISVDEWPQHKVAHALMQLIGERFFQSIYHGNGSLEDLPVSPRLLHNLHLLDVVDGCTCACSEQEGGCSPLTVFLASVMGWLSYSSPMVRRLLETVVVRAIEPFQRLASGESTSSRFAFALIRAITFKELEIQHTCCYTVLSQRGFPWSRDFVYPHDYGEDFPHIREEEEPLLRRLEDLVSEFKTEFSSSNCSLFDFLDGYWKERMGQVRDEMEHAHLTPEEQEAIAALGVVKWEEDIESEGSIDSIDSSEDWTAEDELKRYISKLNDITW